MNTFLLSYFPTFLLRYIPTCLRRPQRLLQRAGCFGAPPEVKVETGQLEGGVLKVAEARGRRQKPAVPAGGEVEARVECGEGAGGVALRERRGEGRLRGCPRGPPLAAHRGGGGGWGHRGVARASEGSEREVQAPDALEGLQLEPRARLAHKDAQSCVGGDGAAERRDAVRSAGEGSLLAPRRE